jgi:hypothetical protein
MIRRVKVRVLWFSQGKGEVLTPEGKTLPFYAPIAAENTEVMADVIEPGVETAIHGKKGRPFAVLIEGEKNARSK